MKSRIPPDGESKASSFQLVPWYRSLGFILSLPGLIFLLWLAVTSHYHSYGAARYVSSTNPDFLTGYQGFKVRLSQGLILMGWDHAYDSTPGINFRADPIGFFKNAGVPAFPKRTSWGLKQWDAGTVKSDTHQVSIISTELWFPFYGVVLAYTFVAGAMILIHRRRRKRQGDASVRQCSCRTEHLP